MLAERCRVHYNTIRPHFSLGYRPPAPKAWPTSNSTGYGEVETATRLPLLEWSAICIHLERITLAGRRLHTEISTIGIGLSKTTFHLIGLSARGEILLRKELSRKQLLIFTATRTPLLIGMEACARAHYLARALR